MTMGDPVIEHSLDMSINQTSRTDRGREQSCFPAAENVMGKLRLIERLAQRDVSVDSMWRKGAQLLARNFHCARPSPTLPVLAGELKAIDYSSQPHWGVRGFEIRVNTNPCAARSQPVQNAARGITKAADETQTRHGHPGHFGHA